MSKRAEIAVGVMGLNLEFKGEPTAADIAAIECVIRAIIEMGNHFRGKLDL